MNTPRILLLFLRVLQCIASLIIVIIEILRHSRIINSIEPDNLTINNIELLYGYLVMNLGLIASVIYIFRSSGQCLKQRSYKFDIIIDCLLMNAWMVFGILKLSPQFDNPNFLYCSQYDERSGCIIYISVVVLGYFIAATYFLTSMTCTWICTANSATNNDSNNRNHYIPKSPSNRTESNEIRNSQIISEIVTTQENSELRTEISLREFLEHNKHLAHLLHGDSELNIADGAFVLRKPSPGFLKYESSSRNSSLYSLDSSFSRIYGSIIISRRSPSELESNRASNNGSIIIGRNQTFSTDSDRTSSTLSDKTSRSSKYDGSIIIKLV